MPELINQGASVDEYGLRYEVLVHSETGKIYHAYRWDDLQVRRACLEGVGMPGQQPGHKMVEDQTDPAIAAQRQ